MRRWTKSASPRMGAFAVAVVTLDSSTRAVAVVILTTDRSLFFSSNPIAGAAFKNTKRIARSRKEASNNDL
jgi:hypothetical protein